MDTTLRTGDRLPTELSALPGAGARRRVLYFMRTAECAVCRQHVKRLVQLAPALAELGAEVVVLAPDEAAPAWAAGLPFPMVMGKSGYLAAGYGRTLGAIQQSGTIVADAEGSVLGVRRATLPFQAFDERELLGLLKGERLAAAAA